MTEGAGLGLVERALVCALDVRGAGPGGRRVRTAEVLADVDRRIGVQPAYAYPVVCHQVADWAVWLCTLDGRGNFGSRAFPPADPQFTEIRLTRVGAHAAAADRGDVAPLPIDLINGSMYAGGERPAFHPSRVARAILSLQADPSLDDEAIVEACGPPDFPGGCEVEGEVAPVLAGERGPLRLGCRLSVREEVPGIQVEVAASLPAPLPDLVRTSASSPVSEESRSLLRALASETPAAGSG